MDIAKTTDEMLKRMAAESVRHGEGLRSAVRQLTLKALQGRELTLARIEEVLRSVTQGVNTGSENFGGRTEKVFSEALAGMDEALLEAAHASHIAIARLTEDSDFDHSQLKNSLDELERWEDSFFGAVREASSSASEKVQQQWGTLLDKVQVSGSGTRAEVAASLKDYGDRMRDTVRQSREATFKTAHQLSQNFATLASGVLIGLSEGLREGRERSTTAKSATRSAPASSSVETTTARPHAASTKRAGGGTKRASTGVRAASRGTKGAGGGARRSRG